MNISELIQKDLINTQLKSHTSESVIAEIANYLYKSKKIKDRDAVLNGLLKREKIGSTGIGDGIAIPHARIKDLKEPIIFVGLSKRGINFSSIDGKSVYLVMLFLTPLAESELHLKILSKISSLLSNKVFIEQLKCSSSDNELYRIFKKGGIEKKGFIALNKEDIYVELASSDSGISEESASKRLEVYGPNKLKAAEKTPFIIKFSVHLTNLLAVMMWICSALCFWAKMPEAGWACIAVVFINAVFSFWQEFKAEKAIDALKKMIPSYARVIREGKEKKFLPIALFPEILSLSRKEIMFPQMRD